MSMWANGSTLRGRSGLLGEATGTERWRHKRRGEGGLARYRKEGNWVLSSLPTPPALARAVSPSTTPGSCMGISQALP